VDLKNKLEAERRNVLVLERYGVNGFDKSDGFELDLRRV